MRRTALLCCAALLVGAGAGIGACGETSGDVVVARVGRTTITKSTLDYWGKIDVSAPGDTGSGSPQLRALRFLIWSAQAASQARELGLEVDTGRARALLEELEASWDANYKGGLVSREAELQRQLQAGGETKSDRQWLTKVHLLAAKVEQAQITQAEDRIAPAQVLDYYRHHRDRFVLPERRDITAIITWHNSTARAARRALEAGERPERVVERFNEQPSEGGLRVDLTRGSGKKRYERDFFAARPHVLIGPLKEIMYYVFEVTKIMPSHQQSLPEVERIVRRRLISGESGTLLKAIKEATLHTWWMRTRCAPAYALPGCTDTRL